MKLAIYGGREGTGTFRPMTFDEAAALDYGSHIYAQTLRDDARRVKINGRVRRWKRDATRIEIPWKYGLYEYGTFTLADIEAGKLLVRVD